MSTLRTFNLQHPESSNNNIQLAEGGGVSVTAGILTATNVSSTNVTTTNLTTTEVIATNGTFSGNLSVGGVLTYEDTTNVDSIGIVTARNGLHVTGGNLGVGLNNPSVKLDIAGTARIRMRNPGNNNYAQINCVSESAGSAADLTFAVGTGEALRIQNDGKVGIGTDNPADKLSIYAAPNSLVFGAKDTTRGNHIFQLLADDGPGNGELRLYKNSGSGTHEKTVEIASSGNTYFTGGNVGVNIANPERKLEVVDTNSNGSYPLAVSNHIDATANKGAAIDFRLTTGGNTRGELGCKWTSNSSSDGTYFYIAPNDGSTGNIERVRIDSVGNMGIGGAPLPTSTGYNGATLHLSQSAGTGGSALRMTNGNTGHTTSDGFYMGFWDDGHLYFFNQEAGDVIVGTNGTSRLRITSDGKVLVNSTANSDAQLLVKGADKLHPALKIDGLSANGFSLLGDEYQTDESHFTMGCAYSAASLVLGWGVKVSPTASNEYLSSQDTYSTRHSAVRHDDDGWKFLSNSSSQTVTTDSVVSLEERLRITSGGELLIGETSSGGACKIGMSFGNSTGNYIEMGGTSRTANGLSKLAVMRHGYWGGAREVGSIGFLTSSSSGGAGRGTGNFVVHTGTSGNGDGGLPADVPSIERTRVDSNGRFYVNTTSAINWSQTSNSLNTNNSSGDGALAGNMCFRTSEGALILANDADSGYSAMYVNKFDWNSGDDSRWINFYLNGAGKDSITWNGSNIVYGQSSDYRIKTNIRDFTGGIDLVKRLPVRLYDYIETERGTDHVGFIAHELQEVLPDAVSGEKDAMRIEEETGEEVMNIQTVEYGKVTPLLTAALKEAIAKIEALEARITALEG